MLKKKILAVFALFMLVTVSIFSSSSGIAAYVEGCKFYSEGDWESATIMLRKAVSYPENFNPDVYYMLITAEVYAGDEKGALDDCNIYLNNFPNATLYSRVRYFKGKLLFDLGEYEKAIVELSDFCHQYVDDELYSYALYYIGESLFAGYRYEEARGIFDRIVIEFPDSEKAPAAQFRIETILQSSREEKLLYLLKQTGEEYLSAKEEYEKQLKMYNSETLNSTKQKLAEIQSKNTSLEKQVADLKSQLDAANAKIEKIETEKNEAVKRANELASSQNMYVPAPVIDNTPEELQPVISVQEDIKGSDIKVSPLVNKKEEVPSLEPYDETREQLRILKEKAREVQKILGKEAEN